MLSSCPAESDPAKLIVAVPSAGALAVIWLIAACALAFGVVLLALAVRLREIAARGTPSATA